MNLRLSVVTLSLLAAAAVSSHAGTIVVPPSLDETGGTSTAFRSLPRTYMALYTSVNFTALTGPTLLTGLQLRISASGNETLPATWPSQTLSFASFDIQLSQASASLLADGEFLSSAVTFASQQAAGTVKTVRSGNLAIPTASFENTGSENAFGLLINFSTPYLYTPGQSLLLYLTHTGYTPSGEPQPFFASTDYENGTTDAISSTVGYQAATASGFSSPYIVQFTTAAVPEPGSMLMLAAGVAGLLALNRRRALAQA